MEDIANSLYDQTLDSESEEMLLGEPERSYDIILRSAHKLLLPDKQFSYNVVNECNMIKVAIKDLVKSKKPEAVKYAILLQLGAEANLQIDPQFSLWQIGSAVQDYYMNTCLSINNDISTRLAAMWGLNVRQQVRSYKLICRSISDKVEKIFGDDFEVPRHVITMLYDPEVGFLPSLEWQQDPQYDPNIVIGAKRHADHVLIWKVSNPDTFTGIYDNYEQAYVGTGVSIGDYVSRDNRDISENEAKFFRNYHKYNENGVKYVITPDMIRDRFNMGALNTSTELTREEAELTREEAEFINMVRQRFINGEYPIDMLWEDICRRFD